MPHEFSTVQKVDNAEDFTLRARELFQKLQTINPDTVKCTMGMIVSESPDSENGTIVNAFVLGSDEEIAKMFSSLVTITRNGIVQANNTPSHNNEEKH